MFEVRLEEELLVSLLDRKSVYIGAEELVGPKNVEMKIVDDAVRAHRVVPNPQPRVVRNLEQLQHEHQKLVG